MSEGVAASASELQGRLKQLIGSDHVLADEPSRLFYSQDIYGAGETAALVARPGEREQLQRVVEAATDAGYAVTARGGGTSYTGGFLPDRTETVVIDLARLDRVVEVNDRDMYVIVEPGCTWRSLWEVLREKSLRTPFWGPLSGRHATVGGSLSQNAVLWGSGRYGSSADSVLALEVVLADGTLLRTGSAAIPGVKPFFRHYGPDLTGLFLGDCGALGIKARATLRLIPAAPAVETASFAFDSHLDLAEAMSEVARRGLAAECFGLDPVLQAQRLRRESLMKDLQALKGVVGGAESVAKGLKEAARVALSGRRFVGAEDYSMHVVTEGRSRAEAGFAMEEVRRVALGRGREIENTFPKVMRADPFLITMTSAIGPEGERWSPVHGIVPLSEAAEAWSRVKGLFAEYEEACSERGVVIGFLLATVATNGFIIEPVFYWPGPRTRYYEKVLEPSFVAGLKDFPVDPEADRLVAEIRSRLTALYLGLGAVHLQIGKTYRYREGLEPATWELLRAVKRAVDPRGLMSPGTLGLS